MKPGPGRHGESPPIPDSADLDPLGGIDTPGTVAPNQTIPVSASAKLNLLCPHCKREGEGPMGEDGPEWDKEAHISGVLSIAPGSKYVILIPSSTDTEMVMRLQDQLDEWWQSPRPFLIAGDQFKFVRVDDDTKIPALASCGYHKCPGHKPGSGEGMCEEMGE